MISGNLFESLSSGRQFSRRQFLGSMLAGAAGAALFSSCSNTNKWQLGCFTRPWAKHDYREAFDGMAAAGFKYAGLMSTRDGLLITPDTTAEQAHAIAGEAKARGLEIASAWGNLDVRKSVADGVANLKKVIDNLSVCGCPVLLLGGTSNAALVDNYYQAVAEGCDYANDKGIAICIKPHGGPNATGPQCRGIIEKSGKKNFRLWYDPGNIYYYSDGKLDPIDDSRDVDGLVIGMSVKDFLLPKIVDVTPGDGMVDFPGVMDNLMAGGFRRGPLLVECLSPGDLKHVNAEAVRTYKFLTELVNEKGLKG